MKKFVLALCLVFAFSSLASAINFTSVTMSVVGYNQWFAGKIGTNTNTDTRVMKLSVSGTGWKALAEYNGAAVLDDWYFSTDEKIFKLEAWGKGEDQNNDYTTPFGWVNATDDAPTSNWEARLTTTLLGGETVFSIENGTAPIYYAFYKRAFGDTTVGTGYKTTFNHSNTLSAYAISKLPGVTVTGEVAAITTSAAGVDSSTLNYGAQGVFDFGLTLKGSYVSKAKQLTVEATQVMADNLSRYYGKYYDNNGTKQIIGEVTFRSKNDQTITDAFVVNNTWSAIAANGNNKWLKNTGWVAGAKVTRDLNSKLTLNLNGFYEFIPAKVKALATFNWAKTDLGVTTYDLQLRGLYTVNNKFTIHPRLFIDQTWVKAGTYLDYVINKGRIVGAAWYEVNTQDSTKSGERFELGWSLSF